MPPFQPGQSGNKRGRPRLNELSLTDVLRRKANSPRNKSKLADQLIALATRGKTEGVRLKAIGMLLDQLDGKPAPRPVAKKDEKIEVIYGSDQTA